MFSIFSSFKVTLRAVSSSKELLEHVASLGTTNDQGNSNENSRGNLTTTWAPLISVFFFVKRSKTKMLKKPASIPTITNSNITSTARLSLNQWNFGPSVHEVSVRSLVLTADQIGCKKEGKRGGEGGGLTLSPRQKPEKIWKFPILILFYNILW